VRITAVIPVKPAGKQRLAGVLDAAMRRRLVEAMLERVLDAAGSAQGLAGLGILTRDASLVPAGIEQLPDPGTPLNEALAATAAVLAGRGAEAMLVLPGDLPFITASDVEALLALARPRRVVVVPDARGSGTNALLLAPAQVLAPHFGPGSLSAHLAAAAAACVDCQVCVSAPIGRDIDEPADLGPLLDEARFDFLRWPAEARCG
jgi:2-phospho-L-lactate/phosphoenolpyruvate guanylyltransferase